MLKSTSCLLILGAVACFSARPALAVDYEAPFRDNAPALLQHDAQAALKANPKDAAAWAWMARALYEQGQFDAAQYALNKAGNGREALLARGDYALFVGEFPAAIDYYTQAQKLAKDDVNAAWGIAAATLRSNQYDKAYELAKAALPAATKAGPFWQSRVLVVLGGAQGLKANLGNLMEKIHYGPGVKGTLEQAVSVYPRNADAQMALGRFYLEAPGVIGGDPAKSLPYLEKAVGMQPYDYEIVAWYIRGLVANHQNAKAREALADYHKKFLREPEALREVTNIHA
ncbi:MAG TPA: tetratricopeptide repeat protein [Oscillatoriaceae cyanobacterium]